MKKIVLLTTFLLGLGTYAFSQTTITVQWGNTSLTYNGFPQAPTATATDNGVDVPITVTGALTDIGSGYTATATTTDGYILLNASTTFEITPAVISIQWSNTSLYYSGIPLAPTATATGFGSDILRLSVSGEQTDVGGPYTATAELNPVNSNYILSNNSISFNISPLTDLFTVSPAQLQFIADGENKDITLVINDPAAFNNYCMMYSLNIYVSSWTTSWISGWSISGWPIADGSVLTFTGDPNPSVSPRSGVIHIWFSASGSSTYNTSNGYEIPVSQLSLKAALLTGMLDFDLSNRSYTGYAQTVDVTLNSAYSGLGAITVLYDGSPAAPVHTGTYVVSINALEGANFDEVTNLVLGSFTIYPAPLTIRPHDMSRMFGDANPSFTFQFTSLQGSDTPADILNLTATTTATISSPPGVYPITASGGINPNYSITCLDAQLTVTALTLTVSPTSLDFTDSAQSKSFGITSNSGWNVVSDDPSWMSVSPSSGNNNGTITVFATANPSTTPRTTTITVTAGSLTETVTVTQAGAEVTPPAPVLSVSLTDLDFMPSSSEQSFIITSNTDWEVSCSAPWVTISPQAGSNSGEVKVSVTANTSSDPRSATITISGTGVATQTITVNQTNTAVTNEMIASPALKAYVQNGVLYINGLSPGSSLKVYNILGVLVYQGIAPSNSPKGGEFVLSLPGRGVYIITDGKTAVKMNY